MATQRGRWSDAAHPVRRPAYEVLRGTHVTPVAGVDVAAHRDAFGQQGGKHLALDRHLAAAWNAIDGLAREHVAAGVDLVSRRIFGLLQKCCDTPIFSGYATKSPRV